MKTFSITRGLVASLCIASSLPAHEHREAFEHPVHLEEFVVSASPDARSVTHLAQPTQVLSGLRLAAAQSSSLGELLSDQPGISSTYFGPGASRPIIRGMDGDRIRILQDGTNSADASSSSPDHANAIDPMLIERIEIIRGPASLLYGGSAIGGVINTINKRLHMKIPEQALSHESILAVSSVNDEVRAGLLLDRTISGNHILHLDAYYRSANDTGIPAYGKTHAIRQKEDEEAAAHGEAPPEHYHKRLHNSFVRSMGASAGYSYIWKHAYASLAYSWHQNRYGIPPGGHEHAHGHGHDHDHFIRIHMRQDRLDLQAAYTKRNKFLKELRLKASLTDYEHTEFEGPHTGTVFKNKGYDGRIEFIHQPIVKNLKGELGLQSSMLQSSATGPEAFVPSSRTFDNALFFFEEYEIDDFIIQFGGRVENQRIRLRDSSGGSHSDTTPSVALGLVYCLPADWTIALHLTRSTRAPGAQELYADGPHTGTQSYVIGNPNLDTESSFSTDITFRKTSGRITGAATFFLAQFQNFIYENPLGFETNHLPTYAYTQDKARFYGAEFESTIHLFDSDGQHLDLLFNTDLVRAKNRNNGSSLPRIPPVKLRPGIQWIKGRLLLGVDANIVLRQDHIALNETKTDSHTLLNATAAYRLQIAGHSCRVMLRASNLANREARVHSSYLKDLTTLPGRNFTLSLSTKF